MDPEVRLWLQEREHTIRTTLRHLQLAQCEQAIARLHEDLGTLKEQVAALQAAQALTLERERGRWQVRAVLITAVGAILVAAISALLTTLFKR